MPTVVVKDVLASEVDALEANFRKLGASKIERTVQADGKFILEATLPGDPDFPTDSDDGHSAR
jgi:hypothetical protein